MKAWQLLAVIATIALPIPTSAQAPIRDLVGERVRLTLSAGDITRTGWVVSQTTEGVVIRAGGGFARPVAFAEVHRIERSLERESHAGRGFRIGAGSGALTAGLLGVWVAQAKCGSCDPNPGKVFLALGGLGAIGGGLIGAVIGSFASHEEWTEVPLTSGEVGLRIGWEPQLGQLGVAFSVAFD